MSNYKTDLVLLQYASNNNWSMYYSLADKHIWAITTEQARKEGAKNSYYGSVNYFIRNFERAFKRNETTLDNLTLIGKQIREKWINFKAPVFLDFQKEYWDNLIIKSRENQKENSK